MLNQQAMSVVSGLPPFSNLPFAGRSYELTLLRNTLKSVSETQQSSCVVILGPSGIGKSRLVDEFEQSLPSHIKAIAVEARPDDSSLALVQRILRQRFEIKESMTDTQMIEVIRQQSEPVLDDPEQLELFLKHIGIIFGHTPSQRHKKSPTENPDSVPPGPITEVKHSALGWQHSIRLFFEKDSARTPILLLCEDLHWADQESVDLLTSFLKCSTHAPIFFLFTAHEEMMGKYPTWLDEASVSIQCYPMRSLPLEESKELVMTYVQLVGDIPEVVKSSLDKLVDQVVTKAQGNPDLLEHNTQDLFRSGVLRVNSGSAGMQGLISIDQDSSPDLKAIRENLDEAALAKVASLNPEEIKFLEMASIHRPSFWMGALVAMGRLDKDVPRLWGGGDDLQGHHRDLLSGLMVQGIVVERKDSSILAEKEYAFKQSRERDAIYASIAPEKQKTYHSVLAQWLEFHLGHRLEEHQEALAEHFAKAGANHRAGEYFIKAADRARERYSNQKAATLYQQGLGMYSKDDAVRLLWAWHNHGDVLQVLGHNEKAIEAFHEMLLIAYKLDIKGKGGAAHNRIGRVYRAMGRLDDAMRHLGTAHALFDSVQDHKGVAASLDDIGKVHWMKGSYDAAIKFIEQGLYWRRALHDKRSIALSLNNLGIVCQDSGRFEQALAAFQEAIIIRKEIRDKPGLAQSLNNLGTVYQDNGDPISAEALWNEALQLSEQIGDRMRETIVLTNLGESAYRQGNAGLSISILNRAKKISANLNDLILEGEIQRGLAKATLLLGDTVQAVVFAKEALRLFEQANAKPFLAVALRTAAEVAAELGGQGTSQTSTMGSTINDELPESMFERALQIFEETGNEIEVARTCNAYAAFLSNVGSEQALRARETMLERAREIRNRLVASERMLLDMEDKSIASQRPNLYGAFET